MGFYVKNAEKYLIKKQNNLKNFLKWQSITSHDIVWHLSKSICMYGSHSVKNLLVLIGPSRGNSRPLAVIPRIVKRMCFINVSNQPFDAEKVPFGRILSACAWIIHVVTHKPEVLFPIIHANNSFSIAGCWHMSALPRRVYYEAENVSYC